MYKETTIPRGISQYAAKKILKAELNGNLLDRDIYRLAKKHLTQASAQFIIQQAEAIGDAFTHAMLEKNKKIVEGKIELPDYYSLTGAFKICLKKNISILLKIKKCVHSHRYQEPANSFEAALFLAPSGEMFRPFLLPIEDGDFPVVVVEGKRSGQKVKEESTEAYLKRLMQDFDFFHFSQLDGAQHKQYTSDEDGLSQLPSEVIPLLKETEHQQEAKKVDALKLKAQEIGCSFHNQSLLILSHIFSDTFSHQMENESAKLYHQTAKLINLKE